MKPIDVKSNIYIDFNVQNIDKDAKFQVFDHLRISKYRKLFAKRLHSKLVRFSLLISPKM